MTVSAEIGGISEAAKGAIAHPGESRERVILELPFENQCGSMGTICAGS